jgi:starch synthase (maltosyl-transferring)
MIIYNLFPLLAGRFTQWQRHLERAADMEFDWLFVNPIQKPGKSGSLYSIADYFDYHPRLIDRSASVTPDEQVKATLRAARKLELRVMTDLVANHSASDSALTKQHPEWYVRKQGRIEHPSCIEDGQKVIWHDLARFDYEHGRDLEGLYAYLVRVVRHLLELGFEGFRCDAAYQVPTDIWHRLITEVKADHPDVCFVAETLGCTPDETRDTAAAGFDYVFNSSKYWNFHDHWLMEQYNLVRDQVGSIGFPESHDTPRLMEETHGNVDALKQRYLFSALYSAGVMTVMGFEFGFRKKPHVVHTEPDDWEETDVDLRKFIRKVNRLKSAHEVFNEEAPTNLLHCDNSEVLLMWKGATGSRDEALVILNKDIHGRQDFWAQDLRSYVQSGAKLRCESPQNPMDHVAQPFHYQLRPGEAVVLVTER